MTTSPPISEVSDLQLIEQQDSPQAQVEEKYDQAKHFVTNIIRRIDIQERPTRESQIRMWKYLDLLWSGITNFYWNAGVQRYSPITADDLMNLSSSLDIDPTLLNKTINMIRPYGESIVGALTTAVPRNKYYPSDADVLDDINTAKAYVNIEQKIALDNQMKLKIIQMIVAMLNGGFFAIHNYPHSHERYGTISQPEMGEKNFRITNKTCPECGATIDSQEAPDEEEGIDTAAGMDIGLDETINEAPEDMEQVNPPPPPTVCPNCQTPVDPIIEILRSQRLVQTGTITIPKTRVLLDVYGPLNIKIPCHASKKEEVLWCILEKEIHESQARRLFKAYRDKIVPGTPSGDLAYDRWARTQYENTNELNHYYVTMRWLYLQPDGYEILGDTESPELLEALFPKGLLAVFANETLLFIEEAEMEEYWTFSFNPIYKRLYGDPLLKAAIPLQEVSNDLFQLEIETVKHAIPQSFADPEVLDFQAYAEAKAEPGSIFPAKMPAGRSLSDAIHTTITANLPKEVEILEQKIEKLFQFILGAFPSVFGGEASGSKTLGEYEQSRSTALQRLSANPQAVVHYAYAEAMGKAVKMYGEELAEDESYVIEKGNSFINVWIRKAHLQGKIGQVRPETSEQFPNTWGQKKAAWLELVGLNNETITQTLFHPENLSLLKEIIGMDDLYIPGDDQRNKQLTEIKFLIDTPPVEGMLDPMTGQAMPTSSVPIEPVDDDTIHIATLSAFICSEVGQAIKEENQVAYMNLLLHLQEHQMRLQEQMIAQQMAQNQDQNKAQVGEAQ